MSLRLRSVATSLRTRLALALALVMLGPVIVAVIAIGIVVPSAARASARSDAERDAGSAALALATGCQVIGDAATAFARQVADYAARSDQLPASTAQLTADRAVLRRPGVAAAVLGPDGTVLAVSGAQDGRGPASAGGYGSSCSRGWAGRRPDLVALAETVPVSTRRDGKVVRVASVVLWQPVGPQLLHSLLEGIGSTGQLRALPSGTSGSSGTSQSSAPPERSAAPSGTAGDGPPGRTVAVERAAGPGMPFRLQAVQPIHGADLGRLLALLVLAAGLLALVLTRVIANRLTDPLEQLTRTAERLRHGDLSARSDVTGSDETGQLARALDSMAAELQTTIEQVHLSRDALSETFDRFVEALGRTHDLDGLLQTVVTAGAQITGAPAALALLEDADGLHERARAMTQPLADQLSSEAEAMFVRARADDGFAGPVLRSAPGLGLVLIAPLRAGDRLTGVLAFSRDAQAGPFSPQVLEQVGALAQHAGTAIANVRTHEEVRRLSVTDPLTGVGNVRQLSMTLSREVERATRFDRLFTVLMLDLDHFKQVNDTLGHPFGDAVLRDFARRLRVCLREVDTVARYGGEEFAIVLPETDLDGGCRVAERVIEAVRVAPFALNGVSRAVTVSIGVATFPAHGRSSAEILRSADRALYAAKAAGRDRWTVSSISAGPASSVPQAG